MFLRGLSLKGATLPGTELSSVSDTRTECKRHFLMTLAELLLLFSSLKAMVPKQEGDSPDGTWSYCRVDAAGQINLN